MQRSALLGVFTDGDLRRVIDRQVDLHATTMQQRDDRQPAQHRTAGAGGRSGQPHGAARHHRTAAWSMPRQQLVGALNIHDLLRAGVV
jgi:arabinose-5-phosphate isomerase